MQKWPCGITDMMLSPLGDSIMVVREDRQTTIHEMDFSRLLGPVFVFSHHGKKEYTKISLKDLGEEPLLTDGTPFWMGGQLYFDSEGTIVHADHLNQISIRQRAPEGFNRCSFSTSFPENANVIPECWEKAGKIYLKAGANFVSPASVWRDTSIQAIKNPLVVFTRSGDIAMVIERGRAGEALGVYSRPSTAISLRDPDALSFILPTELEGGGIGFWTDTPFEADGAQVAEYEIVGDGQPKRVGSFSDTFHQIVFQSTIGSHLDRLSPQSRFQLGASTGPKNALSFPIEARRSLVRQGNGIIVWLEETQDHSQRIMVQTVGKAAYQIAKCERDYPQAVQAIALEAPDGDSIPAYWTVFDGRTSAPLAIELHGGPAGNRSAPENGSNLFASTAGIMLREEGFQAISIEYPGSGVVGRRYRAKLAGNTALVAATAVKAANDWASNRSQSSNYKPTLVGTSYGAYLGAASLVQGVDNSGFIFDSGIYDPETESKASVAFKTGDNVFRQGKEYFSPLAGLEANGAAKIAGRPILLSYTSNDARVAPEQTTAFATVLGKLKADYRVFNMRGSIHSVSILMLPKNAEARQYINKIKAASGPFAPLP